MVEPTSVWTSAVPLESPPASIIGDDGVPHYGTYAGPLQTVSFDGLRHTLLRRPGWRTLHHKRWLYTLVATPQHLCAVAVVHLGYAATAFVVVVDRRTRSMLYDRSFFTLPRFVRVEGCLEDGCDVHFRAPGARISFHRPKGSAQGTLAADAGTLSLRATIDAAGCALPISIVAPVPDGVVNATEKRVLMPARGALIVGSTTERFDDGIAGMDFTYGLLARHTQWCWAMAMGKTTDGRAIAFNLVDGFNEGRECAIWLDGRMVPTESAIFTFDRDHVLSPWHLSTPDGRVDVNFEADALHAEHLNLGLIRSRFAQPFGTFSGKLSVPGQPAAVIERVPGVVESQDVHW